MKKIILIDVSSLIYRCFFALPPLKSSGGEPTGALYGFSSILLKVFREFLPDYVAAAHDRPEPTFRKKEFKEYKMQRPAISSDLVFQLKEIKNLLPLFGVKSFEFSGFEADDIIATLVKKFENCDSQIIILSGDLDTLQLVKKDKIIAWIPKKGISNFSIYNEDAVINRYGIKPSQLPDYKGLVGDKSDNIPGVNGVGPKNASLIIKDFGDLEEFYTFFPSSNFSKNSMFKKIIENKDKALMFKRLATLSFDVPLGSGGLEEIKVGNFNKENLKQYFQTKGFYSLISRL